MTVYCVSQFFNELDLLEIKLHTLDPYVDCFIISESTKTHSGLNKPLYYKENKNRYLRFHHKIVHEIIDNTPDSFEEIKERRASSTHYLDSIFLDKIIHADWFSKNVASYIRDTYEKEHLFFSLFGCGCNNDDIVLFGDLDEIPSPQALIWLLENFEPDNIYHFKQKMFYYYLNLEKRNEKWQGTLATSFKNIVDSSFCKMRTHKEGFFVEDGGWHFTYMGGPQKVLQKVQSWGEQSLNVPMVINNIEDNVIHSLSKGHDLFYRKADFVVRDIDDGTFPEYIVQNKKKFKHMILSSEGKDML